MLIKYSFIILLTLIYSGCASKYDEFTMDKAQDLSKRTIDLKMDHLAKEVKTKIQPVKKDDFIILNQSYDLETLLEKLSDIDENIYYLKNYKDFIVPVTKTKIHNFEELKNYLRDLSDLNIEIMNNKLEKSLPKVVKVSSASDNKLSLYDILISLEKDSTLVDIVDYINNNTKFTIFINKNSFKKTGTVNNSSQNIQDIVLDDELRLNYKINMDNWRLSKLIHYLQYSLNLFVDIDYDKQIILISKTKISTLEIVIPNIKNEYVDDIKSLSTLSVQNESPNDSNNNENDNDLGSMIYEELEKSILYILKNFGENDKIIINKTTGTVSVKSSFLALQKINKIVTSFNNNFNKQLVLTVSFYDIILNKEHTLGLDFSKTSKNINYKNRFVQNNFLFRNEETTNWNIFIDSLHKLGYIYNIEEYDVVLTNNIPFDDKDLITSKYIASKTTDTSTTTAGTIISEEFERDEYQEGYNITYLPKIGKNNQVFIKMNIAQKILENLETKTFGKNADTLTLPSVRDVVKSPLLKLREGEGSIVWQRKYLDVADNYSGVIPIEDFIIGGTSGKKFVLKEYLMFVKVKKIK